VLVFLVMFLFLQNFRYTIIPTSWCRCAARHLRDAADVRLFDQHADDVRHGAGDRILVDDASSWSRTSNSSWRRRVCRRRSHAQGDVADTSAIVGITTVLAAVFVPMAFFPGSVGIIYRQFSVTMGRRSASRR